MLYKSSRVQMEWDGPSLSPLLKSIVEDAEQFSQIAFDKDLFITCIWRSQTEDKALSGTGVHVFWKAIDVRAASWNDPEAESMVNRTNLNWIYDPSRPEMEVAFYKEHGDGFHVHYQVHPNTKPR